MWRHCEGLGDLGEDSFLQCIMEHTPLTLQAWESLQHGGEFRVRAPLDTEGTPAGMTRC